MLSLSKVVKRFSVHPPPQSLMFTKMIFKKNGYTKKLPCLFADHQHSKRQLRI